MGLCLSKPRHLPPPTDHVSQSKATELRQGSPPPVQLRQGSGVSLLLAKPVRPVELTPASIPPRSKKLPPRPGSLNPTPVSRRPASSFFGSTILEDSPVSEGGTSRYSPSSSAQPRSRSFSMVTPRTSARAGARDKASVTPSSSFSGGDRGVGRGIDIPDRRGSPRAAVKRSATRGNNTEPLLPTVREVLPEGFRYVLRP